MYYVHYTMFICSLGKIQVYEFGMNNVICHFQPNEWACLCHCGGNIIA